MKHIEPLLRLKTILLLICGVSLVSISLTAYAGKVVIYVHTDRLGNPVAKTDSSGAVIWRQSYTPYGETTRQPDPNGPGFTGHRHDAATGLVYMQARYYDPKIGRFLSPDPVTFSPGQPEHFNLYWYAQGNPYRYTDPDGRSTCANASCTMSTIDSHPAVEKGYSPAVNGDVGLPAGPAGDGIRSANHPGPTITFKNDDPNGASPNQPVTTPTAKMVEAIVIKSGVNSVNINSTTGGHHAPKSRHYQGKAVDINKINGSPVRSAQGQAGAAAIQNAAAGNPNIRGNFGPAIMQKTYTPGGTAHTLHNQKLAQEHQNHVHLSGQY